MIQVDLPDLEEHPLVFTPDQVVRGDAEPPPPSFLQGRVRLGGPLCVPITPEYVGSDDSLRTFVEQEAGRFAYHLIHMSITFAAEPEKPRLERSSVVLTLRSDGSEAATAWSMSPEFIADSSTVRTTMTLEPTLKLSLAGSEVEAGIGAFGREQERTIGDPYLQAEISGAEGPTWRFRRTRTMPLRGSQRLELVVRAPWKAETTLRGQVTASTLHHTFLRSEHAALPWPLTFRAEF